MGSGHKGEIILQFEKKNEKKKRKISKNRCSTIVGVRHVLNSHLVWFTLMLHLFALLRFHTFLR